MSVSLSPTITGRPVESPSSGTGAALEAAVLVVDAGFTRADGHWIVAEILDSGKQLTTVLITAGDPDFYFDAEVIADDENVIVLARYTATHKATGKPLNVRVAHHFTVRGGLIVRFEQFVDTALIRDAATP